MADEVSKDKEKEEKKPAAKDTGALVGELVTSALAVAGGALVTAAAVVQTGGIEAVEAVVANNAEDLAFASRHNGVVRALKLHYFWSGCVHAMCLALIMAGIRTGLNLFTFWSTVAYLIGVGGQALIYLYARRVRAVSFFDHRRARQPVDKARTRVLRLEATRDKAATDTTVKLPDGFEDQLEEARAELTRETTIYNQFVIDQGPNTRSSTSMLWWSFAVNAFMGFALLYGVVGSHDGGPYSYEQVVPYVVAVCLLPVPIILGPLALLSLVAPFLFTQVGKAEDILTFIRRIAKAGLIVGQGFTDVVKEEMGIAADNGDAPRRNSSLVMKGRFMATVGIGMLKILSAIALVVQHALFWPNAMAFVLSIFLGFFLVGLQNVLENFNILEEKPPWLVRLIGVVGGFSVYLHFFLAGGAPYGYRGLNWWWSDYGPFATWVGQSSVGDNYDTVRDTSGNVVRTVAPPVRNWFETLFGLSLPQAIVAFLVLGIIAYGATKAAGKISEADDKVKVGPWKTGLRLVMTPFGALAAVLFLVAMVKSVPAVANGLPASADRYSVTAEAGHLGNEARRSVGLGLGEGAQTLDEQNDQRQADLERRQWCQLVDGHTRCTEQCYQLHGKDTQRVPDDRAAGLCYDRQP